MLGKIQPDLAARNIRGDQKNRRAVAVAFEDAVDEMQRAGAACPGAGCQFTGHVGISARRKTAYLFVTDMYPPQIRSANGVGKVIDGIANDPVAALDACL